MCEHRCRKSGFQAAILAFLTLLCGATLAGLPLDSRVGGYYKNLLIASRTLPFFGPRESYVVDLNRLRVRLNGGVGAYVSFDIQYDNEILLGSYLDTQQFKVLDALERDTYFNWEGTYLDRGGIQGRHRLYRASLSFAGERAGLRIGRQRLAWGTALFWNPVDILNPFNPIQLEREEREGVDAMLFTWDYGDLSRLSLVRARQRDGGSSALRWRSHWSGFDLALTAGRFTGDNMMGFDFAGQLGLIGLRGEVTRTESREDGGYTRLVLGADRSFANTLTLNMELYFNGQGRGDAAEYDFGRLLRGEILSLARYYGGFYLAFDLTPILRWDNFLIVNLDDHSRFFSPRLVFSPTGNIDLSLGMQYFEGPGASEYGTLENIIYGELQGFY